MPELSELLKKLRTRGSHSHAAHLACLVVQEQLNRPLKEWLDADQLREWICLAARNWDMEQLKQTSHAEFNRLLTAWESQPGTTGETLPAAISTAVKAQLGKPMKLEAPLVMALMDQPTVRALIRDVLQVTLMTFVRKASSPLSDNRLFSGVVSRATSLAKGASTVFSTLSSGLEQEAERRVREFIDEGMSAILQHAVAHICHEQHAEAYAALAAGVLDSALDLEPTQWGAQIRHAQPVERGIAFVSDLRRWVETEDFREWLDSAVQAFMEGRTRQSLGDLLEQAGLREPLEETATAVVHLHLQALFSSDAFGTWLEHLLQDNTPTPRKTAKGVKKRA